MNLQVKREGMGFQENLWQETGGFGADMTSVDAFVHFVAVWKNQGWLKIEKPHS